MDNTPVCYTAQRIDVETTNSTNYSYAACDFLPVFYRAPAYSKGGCHYTRLYSCKQYRKRCIRASYLLR